MKTKSASQTAPTPSWKNAILLAITALALSASPTVALAADCFGVTSWADTTGSWFVAANWLNGQPPTVAIGAQINNGGTAQVNGPEARAKVSHRTLTFIERVAYQRAIEEVYWRHRIWPKERPDPKPSLEAVMSQAQLEKKVKDYLRKSQALEDYWQRPLTAEQLQAEMDRMAQHTKQPEVLKELFDALGNDPFVIAECLARPALANRLLTSWYAHDERIHGALKQRIEAELQAHPSVEQMTQLSGKYSEIELAKSDSARDADDRGAPHSAKLNSREWDETVQNLAVIFGTAKNSTTRTEVFSSAALLGRDTPASTAITQIKTGLLSPLREAQTHYYVTAVLSKTADRIKLATVAWRKEPLQSWLATKENQIVALPTTASDHYRLPAITGAGCIDDTWTDTSVGPDGRIWYTAVWTGSEMIVWGGTSGGFDVATGWRYNPSTDTWAATSMTNAPTEREFHSAVWTGEEMIVWGGRLFTFGGYQYWNTGGRYNPGTDSWTATSTANAPSPRDYHTAVWTGSEMIVWGGTSQSGVTNTGGRYNPSTDSWTATSITNTPTARYTHTAVWSGSAMIVWGGTPDGINDLNTGGRYDPSTDSWTATNTTSAPSGRDQHTAVWTGNEMIVWGGFNFSEGGQLNTGGRYDPISDSWTHTAAWPSQRSFHTAVWTGNEMIIWGGIFDFAFFLSTGSRYDPITDNWRATSTTNAPIAQWFNTIVLNGSEMIVWGGLDNQANYLNTGGRYNPSMDSWIPTSVANAPIGRQGQAKVWSGSEMIVWGGYIQGGTTNTGGRYNPGTDSWTATSSTNAPSARATRGAVWTGNEM